MKASTWYIIFIVALLGIFIALEYNMPKSFVWTPTFSQHDKQPFGSAIFDDVVSASIPDGYTVVNKTFYQLEQDSLQNTAILVVNDFLPLDRVDIDAMINLISKGNKVMLIADAFSYQLQDTLNYKLNASFFRLSRYSESLNTSIISDTVIWQKDSIYNKNSYTYNTNLVTSYFEEVDSLSTVLSIRESNVANYSPAMAFRRKIGEGELYLVSSPLLFTNYGMLDGNNSEYLFRLLSQMKGMPFIRTEGYGKAAISAEPQTPFRYLLSQPPLRWGIYLAFITLVLFMIFTARRRQRAIPVVEPPQNRSLEFVELIGTLYFQKNESASLVRKKYIYFADTLRRTIQVDLDDDADDEEHARRIAMKTGIDEKQISRLLISLRNVLESDKPYMTDDLMKRYINSINKIINKSK